VIQRVRGLPHATVVVDGGDLVPPEDNPLRDPLTAFIAEVMGESDYNAIGIGEMELGLPDSLLAALVQHLPLVSANVHLQGDLAGQVPAVRWMDSPDGRIAITGYLDPMVYYADPEVFSRERAPLVTDPGEALEPLLAQLREEADFIVLLAHAGREHIETLLEQIGPVNVVVQGHAPDGGRSFTQIGESILIIPVKRARGMSQLTMSQGHGEGMRFRVWDLKQIDFWDEAIDAQVEAFRARHGLE
jgi:2',3'-cyclic-nucleotide 2'-phosphodiesterase (5'-nucleotidase family)